MKPLQPVKPTTPKKTEVIIEPPQEKMVKVNISREQPQERYHLIKTVSDSEYKARYPTAKIPNPPVVTPENIEKVSLPQFTVRLGAVKTENKEVIKESDLSSVSQPIGAAEAAYKHIFEIDPDRVSGDRATKGSNYYQYRELQEIAEKIGLKKTTLSKSVLAEQIKQKLREAGRIK